MADSQDQDNTGLGVHQAARLEKLKKIEALGLDPWGARFDNRTFNGPVREMANQVQFKKEDGTLVPLPDFEAAKLPGAEPIDYKAWKASQGAGEEIGPDVRVAGRIMLLRTAGKLFFLNIRDWTGDIQIMIAKGQVPDADFDLAKLLDFGDLVGIDGRLGRTNTGEGRFTAGECPIMITSSGFYGNVKANAKFDWANAPMPYYPDVAGAPQNSTLGGASLWVMGGKKADEYKGVSKFFTFLSDTDRQAKLHTDSGYLPITKAAYEKVKASGFYKTNPYLETPILELTNKEPTENSRGLRLGNMVQMRDVWAEEIEGALAGKKTAQEALDAAVKRGNEVLRQFERTVTR